MGESLDTFRSEAMTWRSFSRMSDLESNFMPIVLVFVGVVPEMHKSMIAEEDEWYVRVNGGAWFGVYLNWNIVKDDGVWCERDGFLGLTSATSAF